MWTAAVSMPGKKQSVDGGYLGLSQLQHHLLVQHTPQNQCYGYRLSILGGNFYRSHIAEPSCIVEPSKEGAPNFCGLG
jgi:hypothetical protein